MKRIEVLGTGCPKCKKLAELVETAAKEMNLAYELTKITDINEILKRGVMITPVLTVDGVVKVTGKLPSLPEIKAYLA